MERRRKMRRINWRERLPSWAPWSLCPETGSEIVGKPVPHQTGYEIVEPEPVLFDVDALRAELEAETPVFHAGYLLAWLQARGKAGEFLPSLGVRDKSYPKFCADRGWERLPWHGPDGVGKHLALLCGGRPIRPGPGGKPTRGYAIPAVVVELAAAKRERA